MMLEESDRLYSLAHDKLEDYDFVGARAAYREAALASIPSDTDLGNLSIAEAGERILFRRVLIEKYPDSLEIRLAEIDSLIDAHHISQAVWRCGELLERSGWSVVGNMLIRRRRLSATVRGSSADDFASDFLSILEFASSRGERRRAARDLAKVVMVVKSRSFAGPLAEIQGSLNEGIPEEKSLINIITCKIGELKEFESLRDSRA